MSEAAEPSIATQPAGAVWVPPSLLIATLGLSLATFMQVLDTTIANVSLPAIAGNLGVSASQGAWVITSFAVSNAIALPLTGWLARRFGEVRLFVVATLLFTLASFLCGVASNMEMLLGFRVLQGAMAGPMYPITQALLVSIYPPARRGSALALLAMVTVTAPIAGPLLGGWITDNYSWRWIFFINVPIGLIAAAMVAVQLRGRPVLTSRPRMDYIGLATLVVGVGALQIMLDIGNDHDWFHSTHVVVLAVIAAISLTLFVIWELTDDEPIVNLRLFRHRNFAAGTVVMVLGFSAFFGMALLVPLWLQTQLGYTATWAGYAGAPIGILPVVLAPLVGRHAHRVDLRWLAAGSFLIMAGTSFWRATFTTEVDFQHIAMAQLIQGAGLALFIMPVLSILLSDLKPSEIADGSGLATFLRMVGGSFAASLTTFFWDRRAEMHHARMVEHITPFEPAARAALDASGGDPQRAAALLNMTVNGQSYMMSTIDYFTTVGWIFLALVALIWLAKPPFVAQGGAASSAH